MILRGRGFFFTCGRGMRRDIYTLIAEGEHQQQDFKFEISDARKIARSLSAFANTEGGRLLVGVKDNGRIAGIRTDEEVYMIEAAAQLYTRPSLEIRFTTCEAEGRTVLIAEVEQAAVQPVYALDEKGKAWAYLRIADENILATPVHLLVWNMRKSHRGILWNDTDRGQKLLSLLSREKPLSVSACCRLTGFKRKEVELLLAQLICMEVVGWCFEERHFLYKLEEKVSL